MKQTVKAAVLGWALAGAATMTAQTAAPAAPAPTAAARAAAQGVKFPTPNPKNFTATTPTAADTDAFLKQLWGYDENRVWSVQAIQSTPAPGMAKVSVLVGDTRQPGKEVESVFYVTPDGKHALAGDIMDFGPKPFAEKRARLQAEAKGAAHGAKGNELLLVEFADLQCPHCKEAQVAMNQLETDFPQARIVFEHYPISEIHPYAAEAAAMGECIRKEKGDEAFFKYVNAVFEAQEALTDSNHEGALTTAIARAEADPAKVRACSATPEIKALVASQRKLGEDLGVNSTPTLFINGWALPVASIPYETLKKMIAFRAGLDGVTVHLQPTLTSLQ
ncbi:thioredoxin domain-containing protein [Granulicella cerasi]|uniref:Thioredoxin domain-containing protein n=1 Tax=Granulicella cerasi TaxID=741063 RepID=A0ABW1ZCM2_9BACT|nr:DsbA family protein [Granulicella cerasi]